MKGDLRQCKVNHDFVFLTLKITFVPCGPALLSNAFESLHVGVMSGIHLFLCSLTPLLVFPLGVALCWL